MLTAIKVTSHARKYISVKFLLKNVTYLRSVVVVKLRGFSLGVLGVLIGLVVLGVLRWAGLPVYSERVLSFVLGEPTLWNFTPLILISMLVIFLMLRKVRRSGNT
ncbi:hypothetical protein B0H94_11145 [Salsuginibacillus halophilus]|uniref:FtsX-like permease family protein n=1 Tax=Salsuginibacillus halophilus TaxID=517424 RepID=A0A2P8HAH4_9BACI|nr:hypothetical protein B0H94_11145 [Salsuginibacillus halophilus]